MTLKTEKNNEEILGTITYWKEDMEWIIKMGKEEKPLFEVHSRNSRKNQYWKYSKEGRLISWEREGKEFKAVYDKGGRLVGGDARIWIEERYELDSLNLISTIEEKEWVESIEEGGKVRDIFGIRRWEIKRRKNNKIKTIIERDYGGDDSGEYKTWWEEITEKFDERENLIFKERKRRTEEGEEVLVEREEWIYEFNEEGMVIGGKWVLVDYGGGEEVEVMEEFVIEYLTTETLYKAYLLMNTKN